MSSQTLDARRPMLRPRTVAATVVVLLVAVVLVLPYELLVDHVSPVDFYVYRHAAEAAFDGVDVYTGNIVGDGIGASGLPFTYTPFAAFALWPTTLFGGPTAYVLWNIVNLLALAYVLDRFIPRAWPYRLALLLAALTAARFTVIGFHHLGFGQINMLLMGLCVADVFRRSGTRWERLVPRGVLIGIAGAVKLTPMLFLPFFLLTRQWRTAAGTVLGFVGATLVGLLIFPTATWTFFTSTLWHLSDKVDLGDLFSSSGNNSVQGALSALGETGRSVGSVLALVAAGTGLWAAARVYRRLGLGPAALVVGLTATMVSPVSWIHHWVYLLPALLYLGCYGRLPARLFAVVATVLLIVTEGPTTGERLLDSDPSPLLWPLAVVARESLLFLAIAVIAVLTTMRPRPALPSRPTSPAS